MLHQIVCKFFRLAIVPTLQIRCILADPLSQGCQQYICFFIKQYIGGAGYKACVRAARAQGFTHSAVGCAYADRDRSHRKPLFFQLRL